MVQAGAGGDDELELREQPYQVGGYGGAAGGEEGTRTLGMGEDELVEGERRLPGLEKLEEVVGQGLADEGEGQWITEEEDLWEQLMGLQGILLRQSH